METVSINTGPKVASNAVLIKTIGSFLPFDALRAMLSVNSYFRQTLLRRALISMIMRYEHVKGPYSRRLIKTVLFASKSMPLAVYLKIASMVVDRELLYASCMDGTGMMDGALHMIETQDLTKEQLVLLVRFCSALLPEGHRPMLIADLVYKGRLQLTDLISKGPDQKYVVLPGFTYVDMPGDLVIRLYMECSVLSRSWLHGDINRFSNAEIEKIFELICETTDLDREGFLEHAYARIINKGDVLREMCKRRMYNECAVLPNGTTVIFSFMSDFLRAIKKRGYSYSITLANMFMDDKINAAWMQEHVPFIYDSVDDSFWKAVLDRTGSDEIGLARLKDYLFRVYNLTSWLAPSTFTPSLGNEFHSIIHSTTSKNLLIAVTKDKLHVALELCKDDCRKFALRVLYTLGSWEDNFPEDYAENLLQLIRMNPNDPVFYGVCIGLLDNFISSEIGEYEHNQHLCYYVDNLLADGGIFVIADVALLYTTAEDRLKAATDFYGCCATYMKDWDDILEFVTPDGYCKKCNHLYY